MTENTTRVMVLNESLYGERNTLAGWQEWISERFGKVPPEYRNNAVNQQIDK